MIRASLRRSFQQGGHKLTGRPDVCQALSPGLPFDAAEPGELVLVQHLEELAPGNLSRPRDHFLAPGPRHFRFAGIFDVTLLEPWHQRTSASMGLPLS